MGKFLAPSIETADRTGLVLDAREIVYDTDTETFWYGDGATSGGIEFGAGGGGGGSTTWATYSDADHTSVDGEGYDIQAADITGAHSEDVSGITTYCEFMNGQDTYEITLVGETVYMSGGLETIDKLPTLGHTTLRRINGKLILYY